MVEINYNWYTETEEKNEDILNFIYKNSDINELAFFNNEWKNFKNFSYQRENIINWYDFNTNSNILEINAGVGPLTSFLCEKFEQVTVVEKSKINSQIIKQRNVENNNLYIYCGEYKNIKIKEKFDYIIVECFEKNTLDSIIEKSCKLLKDNGKILLFFDNELGINNLTSSSNIENLCLRKNVDDIINKKKLYANYYYVFPNSFFPTLIYTDEYLKINKDLNYDPFFYNGNFITNSEIKIFKKIIDTNLSLYLSNSFFVEISKKQEKKKILFVKQNSYRKKIYDIITYYSNGKFYKKAKYSDSKEFLQKIQNNALSLKKDGLTVSEYVGNNYVLSAKRVKKESLVSILKKNYNNFQLLVNFFDVYFNKIKVCYENKYIKFDRTNNIFNIYNIDDNFNDEIKKLRFVSKLYIDMIPQNIFVNNSELIFIDQEWVFENAPIEFLYYRFIKYSIEELSLTNEIFEYYLDIYNLSSYENIFNELEKKFIESVTNSTFNHYKKYYYSFIPETMVDELKQENDQLKNKLNNTELQLNQVVSSKGWKFLEKLRRLKSVK